MAGFMMFVRILSVLIGIYAFFPIKRILKCWMPEANRRVLGFAAVILAALAAWCCTSLRNTRAMVMLHVVVLSVTADLLALAVRRICRNLQKGKGYAIGSRLYRSGLAPAAAAAVILGYGYWNMSHVMRTEYTVETDKQVNDYKLVLITDTHYGTIQDTDLLRQKAAEISAEQPDFVILGGDIVEEGTSKEKMQEVFRVLGEMDSTYGIFYVYGNHDKQPYTASRSYTAEELEHAITENGITILEDNYVEIGEDLILAGRADASWGRYSGRASAEEILTGADRDKFIIVADHQPVGAEENEAQGTDLELSGHTHAGQIWPVGLVNALAGALNYGEYHIGSCTVLVSSGFTGWGYPLRTEGHCEYVVIQLKGKSAAV